MSTPISEIPDDISVHEDEEEEKVVVENTKPVQKIIVAKNSCYSLKKYKEFIMIFIATFISLKIPMTTVHEVLPSQVFYFGDASIQALYCVLIFIAIKLLWKQMDF